MYYKLEEAEIIRQGVQLTQARLNFNFCFLSNFFFFLMRPHMLDAVFQPELSTVLRVKSKSKWKLKKMSGNVAFYLGLIDVHTHKHHRNQCFHNNNNKTVIIDVNCIVAVPAANT